MLTKELFTSGIKTDTAPALPLTQCVVHYSRISLSIIGSSPWYHGYSVRTILQLCKPKTHHRDTLVSMANSAPLDIVEGLVGDLAKLSTGEQSESLVSTSEKHGMSIWLSWSSRASFAKLLIF